MSTIVFFVVIAVIASLLFLWRNNITEKSWMTTDTVVSLDPSVNQVVDRSQLRSTKKVALIVFLAVVTSIFSLFISAYFMRMELDDWRPLKEPDILWFNTFVLVLASLSIQWAGVMSRQANDKLTKLALLVTGILTTTFLVAQLLVWQLLTEEGFYMQSNPAVAFFFVVTGLHGLHIVGGLWVWLRTTLRVFSGMSSRKVLESIELCQTYWHFLLLVWLAVFGLFLST